MSSESVVSVSFAETTKIDYYELSKNNRAYLVWLGEEPMRLRTMWIAAASMVAIVLIVATSLPPAASVQAEYILQGMPSLEGYHIYFTEAGGEASRFDRTDSGLSRLAGLFELQGADLYTMEWRNGVPPDADLVIIAGPTKDLTADQTAWLWAYLQEGGHLLLLADPTAFQSYPPMNSKSGLVTLMWDDMGVSLRDDVVVTEGGSRFAVPPGDKVQKDTPTPTPLPPVEQTALVADFITSNFNSTHPILAGIEGGLAFFEARSLEVDEAPSQTQVTALVFSDSSFYGESAYDKYLTNVPTEYNIGTDTTRANLVLAAALENSKTGTRIVAIGDRDFATNGHGLQTSPPYSASFLYPDNVRFLLNSVSWLLGAEGQINMTFSTPGPTATPTMVPSPTPTEAPTEGGSS
jgi:hypothetical protein